MLGFAENKYNRILQNLYGPGDEGYLKANKYFAFKSPKFQNLLLRHLYGLNPSKDISLKSHLKLHIGDQEILYLWHEDSPVHLILVDPFKFLQARKIHDIEYWELNPLLGLYLLHKVLCGINLEDWSLWLPSILIFIRMAGYRVEPFLRLHSVHELQQRVFIDMPNYLCLQCGGKLPEPGLLCCVADKDSFTSPGKKMKAIFDNPKAFLELEQELFDTNADESILATVDNSMKIPFNCSVEQEVQIDLEGDSFRCYLNKTDLVLMSIKEFLKKKPKVKKRVLDVSTMECAILKRFKSKSKEHAKLQPSLQEQKLVRLYTKPCDSKVLRIEYNAYKTYSVMLDILRENDFNVKSSYVLFLLHLDAIEELLMELEMTRAVPPTGRNKRAKRAKKS